MTISQEQQEFFCKKNQAEEYDTMTFHHSEFQIPVRSVLNPIKPGNEFILVAVKSGN